MVCGLLIVLASFVVEHVALGVQALVVVVHGLRSGARGLRSGARGLRSGGTWAQGW